VAQRIHFEIPGDSISIPALRDFQRLRFTVAAHPIDQPMLAVDPALGNGDSLLEHRA
jgi:hypothetical protein